MDKINEWVRYIVGYSNGLSILMGQIAITTGIWTRDRCECTKYEMNDRKLKNRRET